MDDNVEITINEEKIKLHTFEETKEIYFVYICNDMDRNKIQEAYDFAFLMHKNQFRRSGEPYIYHLIEVSYILATLQAGPATIIAGLLHDVVEDTDVTVDEIEEKFGSDVAMLVDSLTKIQRLKLSKIKREDFEAEDHKKIFLGMAKDVRVIIIKLADRLHNLRTLGSLKRERQIAIAQETLEVFAPIAHRLGINKIKSELEDLSLKYLEPDIFEDLLAKLNLRTRNRKKSLDGLKKRIADIIYNNKIEFEIESRIKSIYSIYKKIYIKKHNFDDIYDLLALRIITETEINCYEILGIIHATYKPVPGRFKDYIAVPKPNMYQSLHTTIMAGDGNVFEIQIRTKEMDEIAETGIAAHWRYKEGTNYNAREEQKQIEEKLHWFRDFVNMSETNEKGAHEYMKDLSKDIFEANVYVFTPKGKVVDLPKGSTPIDLAYKIHTKVGDSAIGAVVNGSLVPLNTPLKTSDIVEIKTSNNAPGPNEGWLKIVKTSNAISNIKKYLMKKNSDFLKEDKIAKGKQSCIDAFKERNIEEDEMLNKLSDNNLLANYKANSIDDLFINVSNHNPLPSNIIEYLKIPTVTKTVLKLSKNINKNQNLPVYVTDADDIAMSLAKCCSPIPGDDIVGFITQGKGITVHRRNCPNIMHETKRLIPVYWKEDLGISTYPVDIIVEAADRKDLLIDIMNTLASHKVQVSEISAKVHSGSFQTTITATIYVTDAKSLEYIFNVLSNVNGVADVYRAIH